MNIIPFVIFSVILISMILPVSALQQSGASLNYELQLGTSQTLQWTLISDSSVDVILKMSKSGKGNELLSFPAEIKLPAKKAINIPITVTIPNDFDDNIILEPKIRALSEGVADSGTTVINIAMSKILQINIGDNPVLKIPEKIDIVTAPDPKVIVVPESLQDTTPKSQMIIGNDKTNEADLKLNKEMDSEPTVDPTKECGLGTEMVDGYCKIIKDDGGCLIATAAYGTEVAPQVQFLREIRDNTVLSTASGTAFMSGFNTLYYSFAPTVSDWERENPMFQEAVRLFITPMISTLSIMSLADNGSEGQVLGLGISVIVLNLGMYIGVPLGVIITIRRQITSTCLK